MRIVEGELVLVSSSRNPFVEQNVEIESEGVSQIHVFMQGPLVSSAELYWAQENEAIANQRHVKVSRSLNADGEFVFDVGSHPLWSGQVDRIRLYPRTYPSNEEVLRIKEIVGFKREVNPELVSTLAERPWKVDLGSDVRNALVAVPGQPITKDVVVPQDADLRFALGVLQETLPSRFPNALSFAVSLVTDGQTARRLFEFDWDVQEGAAPTWRDFTVDLSAHAGATGRLQLEVLTAESVNFSSIPLWANPEVVQRQAESRPNVILISLDTVRADRMSLYEYERTTSPNIDDWARGGGVVFDNAIAQAPWTLPSHVSIFTGLDATRHGVNHASPAPQRLTMLAEVMREAGYGTAAITGGGYMSASYGFSQGFDSFFAHGLNEDELRNNMDTALTYIERNSDRPFFLFLHTYEVHGPFRARQPHLGRLAPRHGPLRGRTVNLYRHDDLPEESFRKREEPRWQPRGETLAEHEFPLLSDLYDSGIAYTDAEMARLFEALDRLGLEEDTLVVLTSDHGEMLGEHGEFGHGQLHEEVLRVPLVFVYPSQIVGGQRIPTQVRSIDIMPTVLDLVGLSAEQGIDGVSLWPVINGDRSSLSPEAWSYAPATNNGISLRINNRVKYILNNTALYPLAGMEEVYDLRSEPGGEGDSFGARGSDSRDNGAFRERARARLAEVASLRLRFSNASATAFSGSAVFSGVGPTSLKSTDILCRCVESDGVRTGFTVPPKTTFTLVVEDASEDLEIEGAFDLVDERSSPSFFATLRVADISEPWSIEWSGTDWTEGDSGEIEPLTGVRVWWQGERTGPGQSPSELDPEILEQLRTLGYIR
jgi:arylsulfatase A-like enzyme